MKTWENSEKPNYAPNFGLLKFVPWDLSILVVRLLVFVDNPLVWIFCSRTSNNMINKVHERALRVVLNYHESDFETLMQNGNDVRNI